MRRSLAPSPSPGRFRRASLRQVWRFAAGVSVISLLSLILMQLDKVLSEQAAPVEGIRVLQHRHGGSRSARDHLRPPFETLFPRLSDLVSRGDENAIRRLYHTSCQFTAALVFPAGAALVCYALPILTLWLHDAATASQIHIRLSVLAIGTTANVLMILPLALQYADGWTTFSIYKNVIAIVLLVPTLVGLVLAFGVIGGALAWLALNIGYLCFEVPFMHTRLLRRSACAFYCRYLGRPLAITVAVFALSFSVRGMLDTRGQVCSRRSQRSLPPSQPWPSVSRSERRRARSCGRDSRIARRENIHEARGGVEVVLEHHVHRGHPGLQSEGHGAARRGFRTRQSVDASEFSSWTTAPPTVRGKRCRRCATRAFAWCGTSETSDCRELQPLPRSGERYVPTLPLLRRCAGSGLPARGDLRDGGAPGCRVALLHG